MHDYMNAATNYLNSIGRTYEVTKKHCIAFDYLDYFQELESCTVKLNKNCIFVERSLDNGKSIMKI